MFRCQTCGATDFQLMLQPGFDGDVEILETETHEVEVSINGKRFTADLGFMNQFAVCAGCQNIKHWEYYFPDAEA